MTTCIGECAEAVAEEYLGDKLPEAEAQSFEEHCLECDACFERVRALQAVSEVLVRKPMLYKRPPVWVAFAIAGAAILIISAAVHWRTGNAQLSRRNGVVQVPGESKVTPPLAVVPQPGQPEPPAPKAATNPAKLALLADKSLPPFHPTQVRGASVDEHFESGMRAYVANDCATAVDDLKRVPRASDRAEPALLYSGACHYLLRNYNAARESLVQLANNQDSPLSEVARYYLAQVELAQDNRARAQRWLDEVIALHGDYEARARAQLRAINN